MITVNSMKYIMDSDRWDFQFKGLSTDTKPPFDFLGNRVAVNSMFFEQDTGDFYYLEKESIDGSEYLAKEQTISEWTTMGSLFGASLATEDIEGQPESLAVVVNGEAYALPKVADGQYGEMSGGQPVFDNYPIAISYTYLDPVFVASPTDDAMTISVSINAKIEGTWSKLGE